MTAGRQNNQGCFEASKYPKRSIGQTQGSGITKKLNVIYIASSVLRLFGQICWGTIKHQKTRIEEHKTAVMLANFEAYVPGEHSWTPDHKITCNWTDLKLLAKEQDLGQRLSREEVFINNTINIM